jgi:hypothetical protein
VGHFLADLANRLIGLLLFLIATALIRLVRSRWRRPRVERWAAEHGWTHEPGPSPRYPAALSGGWPVARWTVTGIRQGRPVTVCAYVQHFAVAVGLTREYPRVGVWLRNGRIHLRWYPGDQLYPAFIGLRRQRTGEAEFDRRYRAYAKDPADAELLRDRDVLLAHLTRRVWPWLLAGDQLIVLCPWGWGSPERIPALVDAALALAAELDRAPATSPTATPSVVD